MNGEQRVMDTNSIHQRAFANLDPRVAVVMCHTCGTPLTCDDFMGLTSNHASGELCLRWWCKRCLYHPYAPAPTGPNTTYLPAWRDRDGDTMDRLGQLCHITPTEYRERTDGSRVYVATFLDGYEVTDAVAADFMDPIQCQWEITGEVWNRRPYAKESSSATA